LDKKILSPVSMIWNNFPHIVGTRVLYNEER
jgi:hypothetical protein